MNNCFFISTVRFEKVLESGLVKKVTEQYLVNALSFTEAEARTIEEVAPFMRGEFQVTQIVKPRIAELLEDDAARFYRAKYAIIKLDEKTGNEKETTVNVIIQADTFDKAHLRLVNDIITVSLADCRILSLTETPIVDYFPYVEKNSVKDEGYHGNDKDRKYAGPSALSGLSALDADDVDDVDDSES